MEKVKNLLWKLVIKFLKFLFSGVVMLIGFVEIIAKMRGGNK